MIFPEYQKLADEYRKLIAFYREIGRSLANSSDAAIAMGCKNAVFGMNQGFLGDPDALDLALCEETWAAWADKRDKTKNEAEPGAAAEKKTEKSK